MVVNTMVSAGAIPYQFISSDDQLSPESKVEI